MTNLSDALRGAADRAPLGDVSVSTGAAAGRIKRQRGLRGASTALVGAGAVAVIAAGVVAPGMGVAASDVNTRDGGAEVPASAEGFGDIAMEDTTAFSDKLVFGDCQAPWALEDHSADPLQLIAAPVDDAPDEYTAGGRIDTTVQAFTPEDGLVVQAGNPVGMVVWEGTVVAVAGPTEMSLIDINLTGDAPQDLPNAGTDLVSCIDGTPLPAGKYEFVAYTNYSFPQTEPVPSEEPDVTVTPEPAAVPEEGEAGGGSDPSMGDVSVGSDQAVASDDVAAPAPDAPVSSDSLIAVAEPIAFTIEGDVPEDPFPTPVEPQPEPEPVVVDGAMTPDIARQLFADGVVEGPWNMAEGTQRWVKMSDSAATGNADDDYQANYYGCSWDGGDSPAFPSTSSVVKALDVRAQAPGRINVSYGWVVDGNPQVSLQVTNTSEYSIPGFYEGSLSPALYLVKNGRIVAEAYATSLDPWGDSMAIDSGAASDPAVSELSIMPASDYGYLAPGAAVAGDYLWRDVNGCWSGSGPADVTAGTYTLLTAQSLYLSSGDGMVTYGAEGGAADGDLAREVAPEPADGDKIAAPDTDGNTTLEMPAIDIAPAPMDESYDYAEFQVWTSLGTITVTN